MLVHVVYVPDAERRGPDLDRMGKVEELPDEVGRVMLNEGSARVPTDDEAAAYRESLKAAEPVATVDEPATSAPKTTKARDRQTADTTTTTE